MSPMGVWHQSGWCGTTFPGSPPHPMGSESQQIGPGASPQYHDGLMKRCGWTRSWRLSWRGKKEENKELLFGCCWAICWVFMFPCPCLCNRSSSTTSKQFWEKSGSLSVEHTMCCHVNKVFVVFWLCFCFRYLCQGGCSRPCLLVVLFVFEQD